MLVTVGFDVPSYKTDYQIVFSVHNLAFPEDALYAMLSTNLFNKRGGYERFTLRGHEDGEYIEAAERMKEQALIPLEGPVTLSMIFEAYKAYWEKHGEIVIPLLQDPALIAAYVDQTAKAHEYLEWGYEQLKTWKPEWVEKHGGLEGWRERIKHLIAHPEILHKTAEEQAKIHKVDHVPEEKILVD